VTESCGWKMHRKLRAAWLSMKHRCLNDRNPWFHRYGGRGITICSEWMDFDIFSDWCLANGVAFGLSIDRIDNNGNYEPDNCRWVTQAVQRENASNTKWIEFAGKRMTQRQWAHSLGLTDATMLNRLRRWPLREALTRPHSKGCRDFQKAV